MTTTCSYYNNQSVSLPGSPFYDSRPYIKLKYMIQMAEYISQYFDICKITTISLRQATSQKISETLNLRISLIRQFISQFRWNSDVFRSTIESITTSILIDVIEVQHNQEENAQHKTGHSSLDTSLSKC